MEDWDIQTGDHIRSVQKSINSLLIGIAQEKEYLKIDDSVSEHLGNVWSKAPAEKENLVTIKHLLTMTRCNLGVHSLWLSSVNVKW